MTLVFVQNDSFDLFLNLMPHMVIKTNNMVLFWKTYKEKLYTSHR